MPKRQIGVVHGNLGPVNPRSVCRSSASNGPIVATQLNHTFGRLYSHEGRPSIPPEQLLSALILQVLYSVRSERQLMEQLD